MESASNAIVILLKSTTPTFRGGLIKYDPISMLNYGSIRI